MKPGNLEKQQLFYIAQKQGGRLGTVALWQNTNHIYNHYRNITNTEAIFISTNTYMTQMVR